MGKKTQDLGIGEHTSSYIRRPMLVEVVDIIYRFFTPMLGTVPRDRKIYERFVEKYKPKEITEDESVTVPELSEKEKAAIKKELGDAVAKEVEEAGWTGFRKDEKGLFLYDYVVRGFLKEAGNNLKEQLGVVRLKDKITKHVFVYPRRIYLGTMDDQGGFIHKKKPDDMLERPLRAETAKGPRVALARSDVVFPGTVFKCTLLRLLGPKVSMSVLDSIQDYAMVQGFGQWRSGGYGRAEVISFVVRPKPYMMKIKDGLPVLYEKPAA